MQHNNYQETNDFSFCNAKRETRNTTNCTMHKTNIGFFLFVLKILLIFAAKQ